MADDPIPDSSGRSRRMSEPRLSLNRNGVPKVDFVERQESATTGGEFMLIPVYCCGAIFVLALLGGGIAATVLTFIYLVDDEGKSECWNTTGKAVWTYVIVRMVMGCVAQQCTNTAQNDESAGETAAAGAMCAACINIGMLIYGGIVLIGADVCDGYLKTGLYKLYYVLYIIDCVFNSIMICVMLGAFAAGAAGGAAAAGEDDARKNIGTDVDANAGTSDSDTSNKLTLRVPGDGTTMPSQ